jgi:predicted metalloenzyme YecM
MLPEESIIVGQTLIRKMEAYITDKQYELSITLVRTFVKIEAERDTARMYAHLATWSLINGRSIELFAAQTKFLLDSNVLEMLGKPRLNKPEEWESPSPEWKVIKTVKLLYPRKYQM